MAQDLSKIMPGSKQELQGIETMEPFSYRATAAGQKHRLAGMLLIIVFFLIPIYIFPSGWFQLVDFPIIIIFIFAFLKQFKLGNQTSKMILTLLPFVVWAILISVGYFLYYGNTFDIQSASAILLGFMLLYFFTSIFSMLVINNEMHYIYLALLSSLIGCLMIKGSIEEGRAALSFNNPNQLAYFAVLLLSYAILLVQCTLEHESKIILLIINIIFILFAHYLALVSFSRAGIFAIIILDICLLKFFLRARFLIPISVASLVMVLLIFYINPNIIENRMAVRSERQWTYHDLIYGRDGLVDRIMRPLDRVKGMQLLIGTGPGELSRRNKDSTIIVKVEKQIEVHNMFGDILRSYGIIGFILFAYWFIRLVWSSRLINNGLLILLALSVYNFGNNGIRFRSFWIFMAFYTTMISISNIERSKTT